MKKYFLYFSMFCIFGITAIGFLFAQSVWVAKINNSKKITLKEFNSAYKSSILMSIMSSPVPVKDSQLKKVLSNKNQRKLFLKRYIDQTLILEKAKSKKIYSSKRINKKVKEITETIRQQLIVKEFLDKVIFPTVKVSSKEINLAYIKEKKKQNSPINRISEVKAKKIIESNIKGQKAMRKLQEYTERLRLESKIVKNENRL